MKQVLKNVIRSLGYKINKLQINPLFDSDEPFEGIRYLAGETKKRGAFFEPGAAYDKLYKNY